MAVAHVADCADPDCAGCYDLDPTAPAPADLVDAVKTVQASNARRLAEITGRLGKPPSLTLGLIDLLADETLGVGTTRRYVFTLQWEEKVAAYCDVQEAEIRKADMGGSRRGRSKILRGLS